MCYVVHQRVLRVAIKDVRKMEHTIVFVSVTCHIPNEMIRHTFSIHDLDRVNVKYMTKFHTIKIAVWCARCAVYSTRVIYLSCSKSCVIHFS